jgi:hypothetical protein
MAHRPQAGVRAIELRVHDIGQLFHSLDPLPYRERDLDERVEEYVVGRAGEMRRGPSEIVVHLPASQAGREEAAHIGDAFRNYFLYRAEVLGWELRELFRIGRASLAVGLAVLAASVVLARALGDLLGPGDLGRVLEEGSAGWPTGVPSRSSSTTGSRWFAGAASIGDWVSST